MARGSNVYSEVYAFLNLIGEEYINKIPPTLYELFTRGRNLEYEFQLDTTKDISKQFKNEETLVIISALNLYFFCGEEEREKLVQIYIENDKKQLKQSYSDKLMRSNMNFRVDQTTTQNVKQLEVIKKENLLEKIIKKIKRLSMRNKYIL